MPQSDDPAEQDVLYLLRTEFISDCINLAVVSLPIYEYLITLDQEIDLVWRRKTRFSVPSVLLVSTRAVMVILAVFTVASPQSTCTEVHMFTIFNFILYLLGFVQVALFSALRVSALYDRNIALFFAVFVLGLAPVGPDLFSTVTAIYVQTPGACFEESTISDTLTRKLVLVSRVPVLVADFLVLTLTWAKTYAQIVRARSAGIATPLTTCLARDGTLYFLVLLAVNILHFVTYNSHRGALVNLVLPVLPPILINRFMLNLRWAGEPTNTSKPSSISTVRFQLGSQVVGSMGAPLDYGSSSTFCDYEDDAFEEPHGAILQLTELQNVNDSLAQDFQVMTGGNV